MKNITYGLVVLILVGCASRAPAPVNRVPTGNISVAEVRKNVTHYIGTEVRWGGEIAWVENKTEHTWIEIVSRKLRENAKPIASGQSGGRFLARFKGFLDPVVYQTGQLLTVIGTIEGQESRTIGEYAYLYPVASVTSSHLWPIEQESIEYERPPPWWYYDPWPFYPWSYPPYYW